MVTDTEDIWELDCRQLRLVYRLSLTRLYNMTIGPLIGNWLCTLCTQKMNNSLFSLGR